MDNKGTVENNTKIIHEDLFLRLRENGPLNPRTMASRQCLLSFVKDKLNGNDWEQEYLHKIAVKISNFTTVLSKLWTKSTRNISKFRGSNEEWLKKQFDIPITKQATPPRLPSASNSQVGRPKKLFEDCSDRTKRRKIERITNSYTSPEIYYAARSKLYQSGNRIASSILDETLSSPKRAGKIKNAYVSSFSMGDTQQYSADEALALLLDNNLTKQNYLNIRKSAKQRNVNLYPNYNNILMAKIKCYPSGIHVTDSSAKIELQCLLDHTATRIFLISNLPPINRTMVDFEILYKWGCDGSSGQAQYKQIFTTSPNKKDSELFMFSIVPLELKCKNIDNDRSITLWKNPRTSSTRYCRPIQFEYKKETIQSTVDEVRILEEEIKALIPTTVTCNEIVIQVQNTLLLTMIDGKVCNSLSKSSSQKCYICGCSPKEMNNIGESKQKEVREEYFKFGLSTLHAWIKFFECLLHISYRLDLKKWQIRDPDDKLNFEKRKKYVQDRFRAETGLLVDVVLQGRGTTNDGNTARRFFENAEKSAEITGVSINLIEKFGIILRTMASGWTINLNKFEEFTLQTANLFVSLYPWYYMPATVHKILIHGADVIRFAVLPIGQLSEEAQEARNKDFKNIREHHTRKMNRVLQNEDIIKMLLVTSDPYISSLRKLKKQKLRHLDDNIRPLIELNIDNDTDSDSDCVSDA